MRAPIERLQAFAHNVVVRRHAPVGVDLQGRKRDDGSSTGVEGADIEQQNLEIDVGRNHNRDSSADIGLQRGENGGEVGARQALEAHLSPGLRGGQGLAQRRSFAHCGEDSIEQMIVGVGCGRRWAVALRRRRMAPRRATVTHVAV